MTDLRILLALLALLILTFAHACATNDTSTPTVGEPAGVEGKPGIIGPEATGRALGDPRPVAASRHRHTEPPSRLDQLDWHALRVCESSDNPRAVSASGKYRGLYQFDRATWRSVGGTGDPAQASREEQDYRALVLYMERGAQPWPECGKRL